MTFQQMIYQHIGEIIKTVQYIEWNLLTKLKEDTLEDITLGQIIVEVEEAHISQLAVRDDELREILKKRNDLVHKYFKRKDFETNHLNEQFLEGELEYLKNFLAQVTRFNDWLCEFIKRSEQNG